MRHHPSVKLLAAGKGSYTAFYTALHLHIFSYHQRKNLGITIATSWITIEGCFVNIFFKWPCLKSCQSPLHSTRPCHTTLVLCLICYAQLNLSRVNLSVFIKSLVLPVISKSDRQNKQWQRLILWGTDYIDAMASPSTRALFHKLSAIIQGIHSKALTC